MPTHRLELVAPRAFVVELSPAIVVPKTVRLDGDAMIRVRKVKTCDEPTTVLYNVLEHRDR